MAYQASKRHGKREIGDIEMANARRRGVAASWQRQKAGSSDVERRA